MKFRVIIEEGGEFKAEVEGECLADNAMEAIKKTCEEHIDLNSLSQNTGRFMQRATAKCKDQPNRMVVAVGWMEDV